MTGGGGPIMGYWTGPYFALFCPKNRKNLSSHIYTNTIRRKDKTKRGQKHHQN